MQQHIDYATFLLNLPLDKQKWETAQNLVEPGVHIRPHDDVHHPFLVFKRDEVMTLGGGRSLVHHDVSGSLYHRFVGNLAQSSAGGNPKRIASPSKRHWLSLRFISTGS